MNKSNVQAYDFHPVGDVRSTLTDDEHRENIRKGIQHCLRGDVFQIVLSRRFIQKYEGDDFKLYRALRSINPSTSTLAVSVSSALRQRPTAVSKARRLISTPSLVPPSVRVMLRQTVGERNTCAMIPRRMPNT